jgi:hypothetical protein
MPFMLLHLVIDTVRCLIRVPGASSTEEPLFPVALVEIQYAFEAEEDVRLHGHTFTHRQLN